MESVKIGPSNMGILARVSSHKHTLPEQWTNHEALAYML